MATGFVYGFKKCIVDNYCNISIKKNGLFLPDIIS